MKKLVSVQNLIENPEAFDFSPLKTDVFSGSLQSAIQDFEKANDCWLENSSEMQSWFLSEMEKYFVES